MRQRYNTGFLLTIAFNLFLLIDYWLNPAVAGSIMLLFWMQSVFIGLSNFIQMLTLKQIKPFSVNNELRTDSGVKYFMSFFFMVHYGVFHGAYLIFIIVMNVKSLAAAGSWLTIMTGFVLLLSNFLISLPGQIQFNRTRNMNIGIMFMSPYLRIVPMHIAIIASVFFIGSSIGFYAFKLLKVIADLITAWMYDKKWQTWHPAVQAN